MTVEEFGGLGGDAAVDGVFEGWGVGFDFRGPLMKNGGWCDDKCCSNGTWRVVLDCEVII